MIFFQVVTVTLELILHELEMAGENLFSKRLSRDRMIWTKMTFKSTHKHFLREFPPPFTCLL